MRILLRILTKPSLSIIDAFGLMVLSANWHRLDTWDALAAILLICLISSLLEKAAK